ncbi:hypothetical protein EJ06DRAFT_529978 [Trichodelitschia bisporula]|uniref:Ras guanyl-nucleotide exchange factor RasGEF n=1 Tax=Trichodelitschia bisporula TaxID=703511 RepID=A0A6G1HY67_9PEZI|nr:hypothetical protein EJ06DRAFT_529978 [Trichodelitschia bisporula]
MTSPAPTARSLYRRLLRELPARPPPPGKRVPPTIRSHLLSNPAPIQSHVRERIIATSLQAKAEDEHAAARQAADQMVQFLRAQRMYATLIERYNPGMGMSEEERVRLSARRVGMDLPTEFGKEGGGKS